MKHDPSRRNFLKNLGLLSSGFFLNALSPFSTVQQAQENSERPLLLAHYMPWYQTPEISGYWGWHWTMNHFNPGNTDENDRPEIASHFMPLTGPYDSSDDALLEYQIALMKLSGIDGVIVDWYGMEDFRDYATLNESTGKLFEHIKRAGLTFAICYEDQSIKHMVENGHLDSDAALPHGQEVMQYMSEHWFTDSVYLKYNNQPVLFCFGPQYFKSSTDWEALFSVITPAPVLVTLDNHMVSNALASYPWFPGFGITINQEVIDAHLMQFYHTARRRDYVIGGAFPGFYDIYAEANVRASYGYLDAGEGEILRFTLQLALEQNPDVIQLITWNDYGEGTMIEPTEEYGYHYLEIVQEIRKSLSDFPFTADDLNLPLEIFKLRNVHRNNAAINAQLDVAVAAISAGNVDKTREVITSLSSE